MEDIKKENELKDQEPALTPEENLEEEDVEETEEESFEQEEESDDDTSEKEDDYQKQLDSLEERGQKEKDKAEKALFFNAKRVKELGGDPHKILGIEKSQDSGNNNDVRSLIGKEFAERDARSMTKTETEYKLVMWYVENKGLSVEDAYVLANKGRLQRSISEAQRSKVNYASGGDNRRGTKVSVPARHPQEVSLLERRGFRYNPKTQTYQAKHNEEYYDQETKTWKSRKIQS